MSATLDETPERHAWTLTGHRITQLCVDLNSCRLQSWSLHASLEIRLSVPFRLMQADGSSREIDPEAPEQLAPLLTAINRELIHFTVTRSGSLELRLSDASLIVVEAHRRYEAFEVIGGGALEGLSYRGAPGGVSPWGG
jgi:hypothetical protein